MYYSRFINNKNPSHFSASQASMPRSEQPFKRAVQAKYIAIETGCSPIPSSHRSQIVVPKHAILDLEDSNITSRDFNPPSRDITTNFMLGNFTYNELGLSSLVASPTLFYQHFTPNSFIAAALFPTTDQTFFEHSCHIVTEQTQRDFACNPILPAIQRKLADYALAQFGLRRFGQEVFMLSSFIDTPPYWVSSQNLESTKLLVQMATSLNLLGNQLLAKNLSRTVGKLLQRYKNPEAHSFFALKDTIDLDIKRQQAEPKQAVRTPAPRTSTALPPYSYHAKASQTKPVEILVPKSFSPAALLQPTKSCSTPNLSTLFANSSLQNSALQDNHVKNLKKSFFSSILLPRQPTKSHSTPDLSTLPTTPKKSFFSSFMVSRRPPKFRSTPDLSTSSENDALQGNHAQTTNKSFFSSFMVPRRPLKFRSTPDLAKSSASSLQDVSLQDVSLQNNQAKALKKSFFPAVELVGLKSFNRKKTNDTTTNITAKSRNGKNQIAARAYALYNQRKAYTPHNSYGLKILEDYRGRANRVFLFKDDEFIGYYDRNKPNEKSTTEDFKHLVQKNDDYLIFDIKNNRTIAKERKKEHMITNGAYNILKNMNCIVPSYFIQEDRIIIKNIVGDNGRDYLLKDKKLKPSNFKNFINELEYCYDKGIFLSDIKFDNIMIDKNNTIKFVDTDCIIDINRPNLLPNKLRIPMTRGLTPQILISAIAKLTSNSPLSQIKELIIKSNTYSLLMTMYDFTEGKSIPTIIDDNTTRKNDIKIAYIKDFFEWVDKYFKPEHTNSIKEFIVNPLNKPIGKLSAML